MRPVDRLVIATHNSHKAKEMMEILAEGLPGLKLLTFRDFENIAEPEETGANYAQNARIKALSGATGTSEWCIADDAGLEIDAMDGAPGLYSKRFAGEETSFKDKMSLILETLEKVPESKRTARFRCSVCISDPHGRTRDFEAVCEGKIAREPKGSGGFGYDPIFFLDSLGRTMAELTPKEKHSVSHRGKVLADVIQFLKPLAPIG